MAVLTRTGNVRPGQPEAGECRAADAHLVERVIEVLCEEQQQPKDVQQQAAVQGARRVLEVMLRGKLNMKRWAAVRLLWDRGCSTPSVAVPCTVRKANINQKNSIKGGKASRTCAYTIGRACVDLQMGAWIVPHAHVRLQAVLCTCCSESPMHKPPIHSELHCRKTN